MTNHTDRLVIAPDLREWLTGLYGDSPRDVPAGDDFGDLVVADLPYACGVSSSVFDVCDGDDRMDYEIAVGDAATWDDAAAALMAFVARTPGA